MKGNDRPMFGYSGGVRLNAGEYDRCVDGSHKGAVKVV
jgi:hypothetical protein